MIKHGAATEARDLPPILHGVVEERDETELQAAELAGSSRQDAAIQLRPPVVAGSDSEDRSRRRVERAGESRFHDAAVVYGQ